MMRIAEFQKVSFDQFRKDYIAESGTLAKVAGRGEFYNEAELDECVHAAYDSIAIPARATKGSAGYDIVSPVDFSLAPGETVKVPTGIRAIIEEGWVLMLFPRSSLGFKYRLQFDNSIPVVDADYSCADNEGHIFLKLTNDGRNGKRVDIKAGDRIAQGIFLPYGITRGDSVSKSRNGGIGSTGK